MHGGDADANVTDVGGERPSLRRRRFLECLAAPPAAAALAGCSLADDSASPLVEDLDPGDTTDYPGAMRFGERYAMSVTRGGDGATTLFGRFHYGDRFLRFGTGDDVVRSYVVDGTGYVVTGDDCTEYPDLGAGVESVVRVDDVESSAPTSAPEVAVTERTTIDGRAMLVLEPRSEGETEVTYFVDDETRYLRRLETGTTTVDYRSWNAVEPIDPPDCGSGN